MSADKKEADKPKKKGKGGLLVKGVGALALCGAGAGGAYAYFLTTVDHSAKEKEENIPQLVLKGEEDPYAPPAAEGEGEGAGEEISGEGGSKYRTAYFTFTDDFTSNLKNSVG